MIEVDEIVDNEPAWYGDIVKALQRDRPDEALRQALEALATARKSSDRAGESAAVRGVAKANIKKGDLWNAKRSCDECLQLAKESGDKRAEAAALNLLARYHLKEKNSDQAKFRALAAIEAYKALKHEAGEAVASNTLALAYLAAKEMQQAHELANQALGLFKTLGNSYGQAEGTYTIVQIALEQDRQDEADLLLQDMLSLYQGVDDYLGMGMVELAKAELHLAKQDLQQVIDKATQASELFEQAGDTKKRAASVFVIAKAFETAGQVQDMCSCAEAAYAFYEDAHDSRGKAACLEMVGYGCAQIFQFAKSVELFEGAAFLYRQLKDRAKEAEMLNELAKQQLKALDVPTATPPGGWKPEDIIAPVRNSKRACALYVELGAAQSPGHGLALQTLAQALLNTTSNEEALGRTLESRRIFKALNDPSGEASAVLSGATVLVAQGQKDQALVMLEEAKSLAEEGGDPEVVRSVMSQHQKVTVMKKPTTTAGNKVDIFVAFRGDLKMNWTEFESRRIKIPGAAGSRSSAPKLYVDADTAPRVPEKRPVLFETKQVPATNLEREAYPIVTPSPA